MSPTDALAEKFEAALKRHSDQALAAVRRESKELADAVLKQARLTPVVVIAVFLAGMATEWLRNLVF